MEDNWELYVLPAASVINDRLEARISNSYWLVSRPSDAAADVARAQRILAPQLEDLHCQVQSPLAFLVGIHWACAVT